MLKQLNLQLKVLQALGVNTLFTISRSLQPSFGNMQLELMDNPLSQPPESVQTTQLLISPNHSNRLVSSFVPDHKSTYDPGQRILLITYTCIYIYI